MKKAIVWILIIVLVILGIVYFTKNSEVQPVQQNEEVELTDEVNLNEEAPVNLEVEEMPVE